MKIEYVVEVSIGNGGDNYFGEAEDPTHALISLDADGWRRIRQLRAAVRKVKAYKISEFYPEPTFFRTNDGEDFSESVPLDLRHNMCEEFRNDTMLLNVEESDINWTGCIKHTNIEIYVHDLCFDEVEENNKVLKAKDRDLPLFLDTKKLKYKSSSELVRMRLKGKLPELWRTVAGRHNR